MVRTVAVATLAFFAGVAGASTSGTRSISGVQKVIQMLTDMSAKAKQEKKAEEVAFAKFTTWCSQESVNLKTEIKKNEEEMELLDADIGKLKSDVRSLGEALSKLNSNVASFTADKEAEVAQRKKDHEEFLAEEQDYSESVDALDRAIATLKKQDYDRTGAEEALLQVSRKDRLPEKARSIVTAFIGMMSKNKDGDDFMDYNAPEANGYEFQSSNIVEVLKNLRDEFKEKLGTCQKEEMNSKHAFDMVVTDLTDSIENANKEIDEKTIEKQRKSEKAAANKKQLGSTTNVKAENDKTLASMTTECSEKKLSFAEKQKLRTEEIEAIGKAVEILSSPDVSGNAEKHLAFAQARRGATALVQMGDTEGSMGIRRKVRDFLASEGSRLKSQRLGLLAEKLAADPFAKVKSMIDSLLKRLLEEANEDAQHEGFCDTEMGKSKITRTKLSEDIDGLSAAVEEDKATITQLGESTAELSKEVEELVKAMTEATDMRKEEKARNAETVKDAKVAQVAVQRATAVLKEFYQKALTATALVQAHGKAPSPRQWGLKTGVKMGTEEWNALANPDFEGSVDKGHKEAMQTFGEKYEGNQDENEYGVLALLEVIQSDFANVEADTNAAEAESQKAYDKFMVQSKRSQAVKEKKIAMNNADRAAAESKLQEDIANLKATQDELLAADRYHEKLVPQCVDQGMTFEERTKAREAELASLKEALKILSSEDIATSA